MSFIHQQTTQASPPTHGVDTTDVVLIERSLRDPHEFGAIFDRHWISIHAYCASRAAAAGEDIAAEVFRVAFDRRKVFDRRLDSARPWLYGIATKLLWHHFRSVERGDRAGRRLQLLAELATAEQPLDRLVRKSRAETDRRSLRRSPCKIGSPLRLGVTHR
jgi:DNA-directed RNA polymerase specialized sigma24 family protein